MKIAISGLSCVGTTSTAQALSRRLKVPISSYTLRNLAEDRGIEFDLIHNQLKKNDTALDYELDRRNIEHLRGHSQAIIASDLACWLDDRRLYERLGLAEGAHLDLKIWLEASEATRAGRFLTREQGSVERLREYDRANRQHYIDLYGIDIMDHSQIDWILPTDNLSIEQVVELIAQRVGEGRLAMDAG